MTRLVCLLVRHRWVPLFQGVRECQRCGVRQQWLFEMKLRHGGQAIVEWKWR
jgi:hypothetical protein